MTGGSRSSLPRRGEREGRCDRRSCQHSVTPCTERRHCLGSCQPIDGRKKKARLPIRGLPRFTGVCPAPPGLALSGALLPPPPSYPVSRSQRPAWAPGWPAGKKGSKVKMHPMHPTRGGGATKLLNVYGGPMAVVAPMHPILSFFRKRGDQKVGATLSPDPSPCGGQLPPFMLHSLSPPACGALKTPARRRGARDRRKGKMQMQLNEEQLKNDAKFIEGHTGIPAWSAVATNIWFARQQALQPALPLECPPREGQPCPGREGQPAVNCPPGERQVA